MTNEFRCYISAVNYCTIVSKESEFLFEKGRDRKSMIVQQYPREGVSVRNSKRFKIASSKLLYSSYQRKWISVGDSEMFEMASSKFLYNSI